MRKVIHLIPYDGIGGVERAAASMRDVSPEGFGFHIETIFPPSAGKNRWVIWNPFHFLRTVVDLWLKKPNVLIVSLWRAYAVGILVKLLLPKLRLVVFLHSSKDVHVPDRFLTRMVSRMAWQVWADSQETLDRRLPKIKRRSGKVISFVVERVVELPSMPVRPVFMFWGRIHVQKGLARALRIFASIKEEYAEAQFWIIGPDGGDVERLLCVAENLGLGNEVQFLGAKDFAGIAQAARNASFYLQTSELEGMAMSVVEAMQLGLVPVVTPAGEIERYADHGKNAVVAKEDSVAVQDVLALLNDNDRYQKMRAEALLTWKNKPLYRDSLLAACSSVLDRN